MKFYFCNITCRSKKIVFDRNVHGSQLFAVAWLKRPAKKSSIASYSLAPSQKRKTPDSVYEMEIILVQVDREWVRFACEHRSED